MSARACRSEIVGLSMTVMTEQDATAGALDWRDALK
jgi:hypothetical protein